MAIAIVVCVIFLATGSAVFAKIVGVTEPNSVDSSDDTEINSHRIRLAIGIGIGLILGLLISLGLTIWFFLVVLNCYRYLRDKTKYGNCYVTILDY